MYLGTSIGIAICGAHLDVVCARGHGRGVKVTGFTRIEDFRARSVEEVAAQYQRFRNEQRAQTAGAFVALPRGAGLMRVLELPAEVASNLSAAVGYQVDGLHPFAEGQVYFDYTLLPAPRLPLQAPGQSATDGTAKTLRLAVALIEKAALDESYEWFRQAGIDVTGFTFSAAVLYQALDGAGLASKTAANRPLIVLNHTPDALEVLGLAPDCRSFYSRQVPAGALLEREVALCAAEMRLNPEEKPHLLEIGEKPAASAGDGSPSSGSAGPASDLRLGNLDVPLVAAPTVAAPAFDLRRHLVAYAAALMALEVRLPGISRPGLRWNLLPVEKRIYRSHWAYAAACVLALIVAGFALAWVSTGLVQDRLYASWLDTRIQELSPRVEQLERLDSKQKGVLSQLDALAGRQQDITRKLDALNELTDLLPPTAWLQSLQLLDNQMMASGTADSASAVLQALNQSRYFQQPEFISSIAKNAEGREVFQLRAKLREMPLAAPPPPVGAGLAAAPLGANAAPASGGASVPAPTGAAPKGGK